MATKNQITLKIAYSKIAVKAINSLDKAMKQRIKIGIERLIYTPPKEDIKQMQGFNPPILSYYE